MKTASQFVTGEKILELGHGPGHLQVEFAQHNYKSIGIDVSSQMGKIARHRLTSSCLPMRLVRCKSQYLPFMENSFESIVATFPDEYIFDDRTLGEIDRVLMPGGKVIVIPFAWLTGESLLEKTLSFIFRISHQAPADLHSLDHYGMTPFLSKLILKAYSVEWDYISLSRSQLFVVRATKAQINS